MTGNQTFFSSEAFVNAWVSGYGKGTQPVTIHVGSGADQSTMHGVAKPCAGAFMAEFSADGLYACPDPLVSNSGDELAEALRQLTRNGFLSVALNVRFDHADLAGQLQGAGLPFERNTTHVIQLQKSYDELFAAYNDTHRKHVRRFHRQGAQIRRAVNHEDVVAYCAVHEKLAQQKEGFRVKYPVSLITELVKLHEQATLLVAEFHGSIVAGLLFFQDGYSMMAWHLAADRDYARLYAAAALYDRCIQTASELGLGTVNLGGSSTDSLWDFKASFGAVPRENWYFYIKPSKSLFKRAMNRFGRIMAARG